MTHFDLCLPWYWEYDVDFVQMVERACESQSVSLLQVTPDNLLEITVALYTGGMSFAALLDRAQGDRRFEPLVRWGCEHSSRCINPRGLSAWSEDKATMHLELIQAGLYTPDTILLDPFIDTPVPPELDIARLGTQFVIKPSNGGGGEGVVLGASTLEQVLRARMEFPNQKYLVQAYVDPINLGGRPAWFRIFYAAGRCYPCWWDPLTHIYAILTPEEENMYSLQKLTTDAQQIASICRLDWFSTEIARTEGHFVVVDYVNDGIDTRVKSKALDGVPDEVMQDIAGRLVGLVRAKR